VAGPESSVGRRWFAPGRLEALERRARALLGDYFGRERLATGMPRAEAVKRLLPRRAGSLADFHLAWLAERKVLELDGDQLRPPGRAPLLSSEETGLSAAILERYDRAGLEAPSPGEVARELAAKPEIVDGLVRHLVARKRLLRLPAGLVLAAAAVDRMVAELRAAGIERFTVAQFKERFGLTRKWAIPLLEHLDSTGVTRRVGDERMLRAPRGEPGRAGV
jgi:selenocysteine-specific elongation factor